MKRLAPLLACVLAACAEPRATITPEGRLDVLAPLADFSPDGHDAGWLVEGDEDAARRALGVTRHDGIPALSVMPQGEAFLAARRTRAMMLASPYLSWAWSLDTTDHARHPVRLVVGFNGGQPNAERPGWTLSSWRSLKTSLPEHDRALILVWGDSALQRGRLDPGATREANAPPLQGAPHYIVRGGRENARHWWLESVDLAGLYRTLWPGDAAAKVRVAFIGVAVDPVDRAGGRISGIRLSH